MKRVGGSVLIYLAAYVAWLITLLRTQYESRVDGRHFDFGTCVGLSPFWIAVVAAIAALSVGSRARKTLWFSSSVIAAGLTGVAIHLMHTDKAAFHASPGFVLVLSLGLGFAAVFAGTLVSGRRP